MTWFALLPVALERGGGETAVAQTAAALEQDG